MHGGPRILGGPLAAVAAGGACLALIGAAPAAADDGGRPQASAAGGARAVDADGENGGAEYGQPLAPAQPPIATRFVVTPRTLTAGGSLPAVQLRIDEPGVARVVARLVLWPAGGKGKAVNAELGSVPTGRTFHPSWPKGTRLTSGTWTARVHVTDPGGQPLSRPKATPGLVTLTVRAPAEPKPAPKPVRPAPAPKPTPAPAPKPAPAGLLEGVFPVAGAHTYGDLFGAPRSGYSHQGVDVLAPQGTPIVAPTAGTVRFTDYQAGAAGEYVVLHSAGGPDFFFAHCVRSSTVVKPGQAVGVGARLCDLGMTGDATGPHLHFEQWLHGWRTGAADSVPSDPLPQLKAWEG